MSKYTETRKKANQRWDSANLERVTVALPKGSKDQIKELAQLEGISANRFMHNAILCAVKSKRENK
jgi:hypothetical protein